MASFRKTATNASFAQAGVLVLVYLFSFVLMPMAGMKMEDWYDTTATYRFAVGNQTLWQSNNLLSVLFGITLVPAGLAAFQRFRQGGMAQAVVMRGFAFISAAIWIMAGCVAILSTLAPLSMAAHGHPDPNAVQTSSIIGGVSWGLQNAAIFTYGFFLYMAGRLALASGKLAKWASYVAVTGGIFGILSLPLGFAGDAGMWIGFMLVPLCAIIFNIAFAMNLRNAPEHELEAAMA